MNKVIRSMYALLAMAITTLMCGCGASKPKLQVYMWSDYIDPAVVERFEKENNCKVVISIFDSNESMYAKLKAGATGYDVILPSSYMAQLMYKEKMIDKLDISKIPNVKNLDAEYMKNLALDKNLEYSVPYMICFSCVAYNKAKIGEIADTWDVFADPKFKGRTTMLNDYRETIGAALKFNNCKFNSYDDADLAKAKKTFMKWKPNLAKLDNEAYKSGIQSGEFLIVQGYSGDLGQVISENKDIAIMVPREGVSISCDDWVIPSFAKNKDLAYAFINFVCAPKNAAANMEVTKYYAPISGAEKLVSPETAASVAVPKNVYEKGELIIDLGENNNKLLKLWDELKSGK